MNGVYNYYDFIIEKSNFNDIKETTIIIYRYTNNENNENIYLDKNFSCSDMYILLNIINKDVFQLKYVFYYIKLFINFQSLSLNSYLSNEIIKKIKIPIIDLEHQQEIINILDEYLHIFNIDDIKYNNLNIKIINILLDRKYEKLYNIINDVIIYLHPIYI